MNIQSISFINKPYLLKEKSRIIRKVAWIERTIKLLEKVKRIANY